LIARFRFRHDAATLLLFRFHYYDTSHSRRFISLLADYFDYADYVCHAAADMLTPVAAACYAMAFHAAMLIFTRRQRLFFAITPPPCQPRRRLMLMPLFHFSIL